MAGVLAIHTDVEMKNYILTPNVSNMYGVQYVQYDAGTTLREFRICRVYRQHQAIAEALIVSFST